MYYARNDEERAFDNEMRERIKQHGKSCNGFLHPKSRNFKHVAVYW